jgi:hypothetical protein
MVSKKKTGRQSINKLADYDYDTEKDSNKDSDNDWEPNTGEEEGDKEDKDDDGPKSDHQQWTKNELDLSQLTSKLWHIQN